MAKRVTNWPVMKEKCATCPFRKNGDVELSNAVLERTLLQASQICHHPRMKDKKETHLCRGARDVQLQVLASIGLLKEPTDKCFEETSKAVLGR